jgi:diaminohydroxyphosphoribosylaminopyrimidine deaminase / 5-amino-6-(5-phosphoribosylamino)uracil reductase
VLDRSLTLPENYKILNDEASTLIVNEENESIRGSNRYWKIPFDNDLFKELFKRLHSEGIISILIEGGAQVLNRLIQANLYDEARVFTSAIELMDGIRSPELQRTPLLLQSFWSGTDRCDIWRNVETHEALNKIIEE